MPLSQTLDPFIMPAQPRSAGIEAALAALEMQLAELQARDGTAIEAQASELSRALAFAVAGFSAAAGHGAVPKALRQRLARASGVVAVQRESLARATAALDRAIDVLLPRGTPPPYCTPEVRSGGPRRAQRCPDAGSSIPGTKSVG